MSSFSFILSILFLSPAPHPLGPRTGYNLPLNTRVIYSFPLVFCYFCLLGNWDIFANINPFKHHSDLQLHQYSLPLWTCNLHSLRKYQPVVGTLLLLLSKCYLFSTKLASIENSHSCLIRILSVTLGKVQNMSVWFSTLSGHLPEKERLNLQLNSVYWTIRQTIRLPVEGKNVQLLPCELWFHRGLQITGNALWL